MVRDRQARPYRRQEPSMAEAAAQSPLIEISDGEEESHVQFLSASLSRRGLTKSSAISVEQYSKKRDLNFITIDDDLQVLESPPPQYSSRWKRLKKPFAGRTVTEVGESSNSATNQPPKEFVCSICVEEKDASYSFRVLGCSHSYCTDCISRYVATKLQDNVTSIKCPVSECDGRLEPEHCRSILPKEVFDRWGNALCEALILGAEKFYCPYKDCSAMLINDYKEQEAVKESECPHCNRMFCVQCKVPWHAEISCEEYQKLDVNERDREDIMLKKLAEMQQWARCPKCGFYVEKVSGCSLVKCRCGVSFLYSASRTRLGTNGFFVPEWFQNRFNPVWYQNRFDLEQLQDLSALSFIRQFQQEARVARHRNY